MTAADCPVVPVVPVVPEGYLLTTRELRLRRWQDAGLCGATGHTHADHVVLFPSSGSAVVQTGSADTEQRQQRHRLTVGQGLWLPAGTPHACPPGEETVLCALFIDPDAWSRTVCAAPATAVTGTSVHAVTVPASLRELLLHLAYREMPDDRRIRAQQVCLELLADARYDSADVPTVHDTFLAPVTGAVLGDPSDSRTLEDWAWLMKTSPRTISRRFRADTGMGFAQWRTSVRMTVAVRMLADGSPVGVVARRVGYATVSAFSAAFLRATGRRPTRVVDVEDAPDPENPPYLRERRVG
ncbi:MULTISPECIES: AraC family transcriptional regulator [Corynebacterium]|uniref:AraC-family transcription regulator of iron proteins n=2 Tax=Corynebacterium variabile TaxID=1727 RepID=G0HGB8_CORVD|nr:MULTISPECIES: AraC family transcriptional regulator [Corynebacterium]AEK38157.1 AraC-family transcription regulator of iron proteins [Corynebacterium variabile DSM 44702]MDN6282498.1 AraC family transcriptional regulator [Corynebacterium sp.]MDN6306112.1 AraC family transcriptional regulator [Corynebacterium sp.]MDN6353988.1 AraC family transcriptional regulator [Corynebacterium sp.]MDN6368238.1 AraC family transcriptional regulator [Corynebacterium sp.]